MKTDYRNDSESVKSRKFCVQVIFSLLLLLLLQTRRKHNQLAMKTRLKAVLFSKKFKKIRHPDSQYLGDGFRGLTTQSQAVLRGETLSHTEIRNHSCFRE